LRKSDNYPLVFLGGGLGLLLLFHTIWNILFEDWLKHQLERFFGHTVAEMIERFGAVGWPALAAGGIIWFLLHYAKAHYAAALSAQAENLGSSAGGAAPIPDPGRLALAGVVNALLERVTRRDFKMPVRWSDQFHSLYGQIRNSAHPAWIERDTNQLRRDFLQHCTIVGSPDPDRDVHEANRAQLRSFGLKLIGRLTGSNTVDDGDWKSPPDAVELFADPELVAAKNKWLSSLENSTLKGFDAEDELKKIQKETIPSDAEASAEREKRLALVLRKLKLHTMFSKTATEEYRRAWEALRGDMHSKLIAGTLTAKGFRTPHTSGNREVDIPRAEWRILILNQVNSEAIAAGSSEVLYSGLLIRKNEPT